MSIEELPTPLLDLKIEAYEKNTLKLLEAEVGLFSTNCLFTDLRSALNSEIVDSSEWWWWWPFNLDHKECYI